ncbi:hypothetical protein B0H13DRAFT_2325523 [Mycena leptocephala]|nr:hypothetical protein B0H13DRAFT_2325523 [Mycena leptocephala]
MSPEQSLQSEWTYPQGYHSGSYHSGCYAFNDLDGQDLRPQLSLDTVSPQSSDVVMVPFGGRCPSVTTELFNPLQTVIYTPDIPGVGIVPSYSVMPPHPGQILDCYQDWPCIASTPFEGLPQSYDGMASQALPTYNFGPAGYVYVGWTRFDDSLAAESYYLMPMQGPQQMDFHDDGISTCDSRFSRMPPVPHIQEQTNTFDRDWIPFVGNMD